jgi:hypothetical protein
MVHTLYTHIHCIHTYIYTHIHCIHTFSFCLIILNVSKQNVANGLELWSYACFFNLLCIKTNIQELKLTEKPQALQSHVEIPSILCVCVCACVCVTFVIISIMQYLLYEIVSYLLLGCLIQYIEIIYFSFIQFKLLYA